MLSVCVVGSREGITSLVVALSRVTSPPRNISLSIPRRVLILSDHRGIYANGHTAHTVLYISLS